IMIICSEEASLIRNTTHGLVRGALVKSIYDDEYYVFDGIPYAQPPLGPLRFKEPRDAACWNSILNCTEPREKCLQVSSYTQRIEGSEDCLYLNIAVKRLHSEKPLPVMVYIHGGSFKTGDASRRAWSPDYLMREDVIYISIGFRLGLFGKHSIYLWKKPEPTQAFSGYLSFADPSLGIPGNAGIKDIVLALKWIKKNVKSFNGDANNITLFGHSSGSMLVYLLSVSPQTEGLFHKFALMAGFMPEMNRVPNLEYRVAQKLGYQGKNVDKDVYTYIKNADPNQVTSVDILNELETCQGFPPFTPSVEPYATPTAVILSEPFELQRTAWSNLIPLMLGTTSEESYLTSRDIVQVAKNNPEVILPRSLFMVDDSEMRTRLGKQLLKATCNVDVSELDENHFETFVKIKRYNLMHYQKRLINARLAYGQAKNFLYRFDFKGEFNFYSIRHLGSTANTSHADELCYLFKIPASFKLETSRAEYSCIFRMASMFVAFAKESNPNGPLIKELVNWKPISLDGPSMCLNITEELLFMTHPELQNLELYDKLYEQAGVQLI
ncbi:hypothetical protein KR044_001371, partial [Drosophila immigrans]